MAERLIKNRLPVVDGVDRGFYIGFGSLLQILKMKPFDGSFCVGDIHTIIDFDGVVPEGDCLKNVANLRSLSEIGKKSRTVEVHTSRIYCDDSDSQRFNLSSVLGNQFSPVSDFPLLTWSSEFFLEEIIKMGDKNCRVNFVTGLQKVIGGNQKILDLSDEVLTSGNTLVMIGSSLVDIVVARNVYKHNQTSVEVGKNFFCYNTGHILI